MYNSSNVGTLPVSREMHRQFCGWFAHSRLYRFSFKIRENELISLQTTFASRRRCCQYEVFIKANAEIALRAADIAAFVAEFRDFDEVVSQRFMNVRNVQSGVLVIFLTKGEQTFRDVIDIYVLGFPADVVSAVRVFRLLDLSSML